MKSNENNNNNNILTIIPKFNVSPSSNALLYIDLNTRFLGSFSSIYVCLSIFIKFVTL